MALATLILILLAGGLLAWLAERLHAGAPRWVALVVMLADLVLALLIIQTIPGDLFSLIPSTTEPESWLLYERWEWIPRFGIAVELAMDGLSLLMVLLTLVLGAVAVLASWSEISVRPGFFHANLLWTLAGVLGVFLALDLFLFFLCWEVMLVPMYLLIAIWGHEDRAYASMKFFLFTQITGLLMLFSMLVLVKLHHDATGAYSFSYFDLIQTPVGGPWAMWLMLGFFVAFVTKLPGFPLHTWLPDAHTQAPTAGSVILAGILLKTGAYGLLRFAVPLFPEASATIAPLALVLGAAGVIYGAVLAFAQHDFKRLVAYSSVSHMGFVLLGIYAFNTIALQGVVVQLIAHGLSTAALFMIAGSLQERLHTRDMRQMGGLWPQLPRLGATTLFFAIASLGLPGLGNFIAEFLILVGLFAAAPWFAVIAAIGLVTAAVYSLILIQRAFHGEPAGDNHQRDFGLRELSAMAVLALGLIWIGLYPQPVLDLAQPTVDALCYRIIEQPLALLEAQP